MSKQFEFCRPAAKKVVPSGRDCIHEIKYDGYRGRLVRDGVEVKL
jgi:bifunctional non-homologous end joining protein LigD